MSARRTAAAALVLLVAFTGCTGEDTKEPSPVISGPATTSVAPAVPEIAISVAGGKVTGGGRHKVRLGSTVHLVVTADVSDEVHVHGYDLKANVTPTAPASVDVVAKVPGIFEVELEKKGLQLAQLEVTG